MSKLERLKAGRAQAPDPKIMNLAYAELVKFAGSIPVGGEVQLSSLLDGEEAPILRGLDKQFPGSKVHNLEGQPILSIKVS